KHLNRVDARNLWMRSDFFITSLDFFQGRASTIVQEAFPFRSLQISLTPKSLKPPERLLCSRFAENSSKTIMRSSRLRTQLSLSCFVKGLGPIHTFSQPTVFCLGRFNLRHRRRGTRWDHEQGLSTLSRDRPVFSSLRTTNIISVDYGVEEHVPLNGLSQDDIAKEVQSSVFAS
ncbi:unnamed protein product, partial [Ascophyllum nodosum]